MHVEPIEPRRLMADVGRDPNFGTNGLTTLGADVVVNHTVLITTDNIYVAARDTATGKRYVYNLDARGRIDTTWGTNGRTAVPFEVQQLAYDPYGGRLYAARVTQGTGDASDALRIVRFNKAGDRDTNYGPDGEFTYVPAN